MLTTLEQKLLDAQNHSDSDRIIIIGGGIVGSALAFYLTSKSENSQIILLDDSLPSPQGLTEFAPGLIGQLNPIPDLTEMAKESVNVYSAIQGAFQRVGGLEIATTVTGIEQLESRLALAHAANLTAAIVTSAEASNIAPDFHSETLDAKGLFFSSNGTANPAEIASHFRSEAKKRGVVIIHSKVSSILTEIPSSGNDTQHNLGVSTNLGVLTTKTLIVATGIWTAQLVKK